MDEQNQKHKVVVVGSVNVDHVMKVDRFPHPGETVSSQFYQCVLGGKGANQAFAAGNITSQSMFITCVGGDTHGADLIEKIQALGCTTQGITSIKHLNTGVALINVDTSGENSISISAQANAALDPQLIMGFSQAIAESDYLLLQLETPIDGIEAAINIAKENATKVVLNPAPAQKLPLGLLNQVDLITPNETEVEILTGIKVCDEQSLTEASDYFHQLGIEQVIITLGSQGVWYSTKDKAQRYPSYKVEVKDTTAAGDTFNGVLVGYLAVGYDIETAIALAQCGAAICVTKDGAYSSIPSRHDIEAFHKERDLFEVEVR
ncbi:ribokinase [Vibrio fluminensis]|uniref:ribokinase n=1 Tax=Vibrio fluminensis TaxID=2783614 RepID=UPI0018885D5C|nr:ribokinase [Vibrio fluminensis]